MTAYRHRLLVRRLIVIANDTNMRGWQFFSLDQPEDRSVIRAAYHRHLRGVKNQELEYCQFALVTDPEDDAEYTLLMVRPDAPVAVYDVDGLEVLPDEAPDVAAVSRRAVVRMTARAFYQSAKPYPPQFWDHFAAGWDLVNPNCKMDEEDEEVFHAIAETGSDASGVCLTSHKEARA